jgi:hypothetical protein
MAEMTDAVSAVRFADCLSILRRDPTDESVGYYQFARFTGT